MIDKVPWWMCPGSISESSNFSPPHHSQQSAPASEKRCFKKPLTFGKLVKCFQNWTIFNIAKTSKTFRIINCVGILGTVCQYWAARKKLDHRPCDHPPDHDILWYPDTTAGKSISSVFTNNIFASWYITKRKVIMPLTAAGDWRGSTPILKAADQAKQATINSDIIRVSEFNVTSWDINSHINNSCQ